MIRWLATRSGPGPISRPQPPTRRLFLRDLQAFASPYPFHPLVIDLPALIPQQPSDLTISISSVLAREIDNGLGQRGFVSGRLPLIPLRGPRLPQDPAHPALCEAQRRTAVLHGLPSARWA